MANSRPVVSLYSNLQQIRSRKDADRVAHATTADRAISAAFRRLLAGDYKYCSVFSSLGIEVYRIFRTKAGITMTHVDGEHARILQ